MKQQKDRKENSLFRACPQCGEEMNFYPGCCGNLPLWRCEYCGLFLKWQEVSVERDKYLKIK